MAVEYGFALSSEEHGPSALLRAARRAEEVGFDFCSISDHYHPWIEAQGHSPFVWAVLGAIASNTTDIEIGVGVACPTIRIHPAIIAQAAATTSLLAEGRFFLGVGSGEALNEHILGGPWPAPEVRQAMLEEAVEVMRALWTGETVDHRGPHYCVENARLFDPPEALLPVIVSAYGSKAVEVAARIGDGLWTSGPTSRLIDAYLACGGTGFRFGQIHVCYGPDAEACRKVVHDQWPNAAIPGQLPQELPTWSHFEQVAELLDVETASEGISCGPDVEAILEDVQAHLDAGYDRLYFHQVGPDQAAFLDLWERELGDQVRALGNGDR
jgi:coenzyme F420-dependent glucose-6-phosphate dehydrogenase